MSAPPNNFNSNTNFNKFKGCYFNSDVDCSGGNLIIRNGNLYLAPNSSIYTTGNSITFDEIYFFTNFNQNVHIFGITQVNGNLQLSNGLNISSGNITCAPNSSIITTGNSINFDDVYNYINIPNNFHVSGSFVQDYGGTQYDVGQLISQIGTMTYYQPSDFNLFKNTFCEGQIQFQDSIGNHVDCVAYLRKLNNGDYADKTISNTYTTQQNFNTIRIDSNILLNNGLITLSNSDLQKISLINTLSSNCQSQLSALQTKTTNQTFAATTTTFSGTLASSILTFSTSINTIPVATFAFINSLSSNCQTQLTTNATNITTANTNITALQTKTTQITYTAGTTTTTFGGSTIVMPYTQFTSSLRLDGALLLSNGVLNIPKETLVSIQYLSGVSSNIATSISNLNTKTTDITFATSTTTIANTTACNNLTFSGQFNGVFKANFDTAISRITTLYAPAQTQIDGKVSLTGAESIDGIKSFLQPIVTSGASITAGTIPLTALANSGFVDLTTSQSILTGTKSWTAQQSFLGNIRVDGGLILNGGLLTLSNSLLQFLSGLSSNAQTQFNNLSSNVVDINQKLTNVAYTSASNTTFVSNILSTYTLVFSNTLNGINTTTFGFLSGLTGNIQTQLNTQSSSITTLNNTLTNVSYTSASGTTSVSSTLSSLGVFNAVQINFTSLINGISTTVFGYLSGVTSSIQGQLDSLFGQRARVGDITMNLSNTNENTYYKFCNGQLVSRTTYSDLFTLIGTTYGAGDGVTNFALPKLTGMYLRGYGLQSIGGTVYASEAFGTVQYDAIQQHSHLGQAGSYSNNTIAGSQFSNVGTRSLNSNSFSNTGFATGSGVRTTDETRCINYAVGYYIKVL